MTELERLVKGGDYKLVDLIGMGGFGEVYRAYQRSINREVAMKVLLPNYVKQHEFLNRFQVEAEIVAGLEHPHIVPLYDFWSDQNGAYLVMRLYRGSLQDSLRTKGPWSPVDALRMVEQIGSALHYAHRKSIIHQDIKAANILLDEDNNCYLTDFGIAVNFRSPRKDLAIYDEDGQEIVHGSPEYMAPEQILRSGSTPRTDIYSLGVLLFETLTAHKPFYSSNDSELIQRQLNEPLPSVQQYRPDLPSNFDVVIRRATEKTPALRYNTTLEFAENFHAFVEAAGYLSGTAPITLGDSTQKNPDVNRGALLFEPPNPYKGLSAFQERDAIDFFGREALVEQLSQRIRQPEARGEARFLAVVGPSGSGKSSVVRAGLFPNLRRFSADWYLMDMLPGAHPMSEFESLLYSLMLGEDIALNEMLNSDTTGMHRAVDAVLGNFRSELVVLIDQFEEVFTNTLEDAERRHFLESLVYAVTNPNSRLRVVITLRADFLDMPLNHPSLGNLLKKRMEFITSMKEDELHDAIVKPAERVGLQLEAGLVEKIIGDLQEQAGMLPLLQFALTELYNNRDRSTNTLTLNSYISNDGVVGAMTRRADEIYLRMPPEMQEVAQQIFIRLVALGEGAADTKRRVPMAELISMNPAAGLIEQTLDRFQKRRLLTFDRDTKTREPTVELAHEILIRRWQVLGEWISQNREEIRLQRQVAASEKDWKNNQGDKSFLATGLRLSNFRQLENSKFVRLSEAERKYLKASIQLEETIERRKRNISRGIWAVTLSVLVIVALLAVAAVTNEQIAKENEIRANANRRLAEANALRANKNGLLALENAELAALREQQAMTESNRAQSANAAGVAVRLMEAGSIDVAALLVSKGLEWADTFRAQSVALTILQKENQSVSSIGHLHTVIQEIELNRLQAVALSPNGATLVTGDSQGQIRFWNPFTGQPDGEIIAAHSGVVQAIVFNADGTRIVSVAVNGEVYLWDVMTRQFEALEGHRGTVQAAAFSPDGQSIATTGNDGRVLLWDISSRTAREIEAYGAEVLAVAFSHDGTRLAWAVENAIMVWDLRTEALLYTLNQHTNDVFSIAFEEADRFLVSASADSTVRIWSMISGDAFGQPLRHKGQVQTLKLLYGGRLIVSGDSAGEVTAWTIEGARLTTLRTIEVLPIWSIASDSRNQWLVIGSESNRAMIWDLSSPYQLAENLPLGVELPMTAARYVGGDDARYITVGSTFRDDRAAVNVWVGSVLSSSMVLQTDGETYVNFAISPDGQVVAGVTPTRTVRFFDSLTGQKSGDDVRLPSENLSIVAFNADGTQLAVGTRDGDIYLLTRTDNIWKAQTDVIRTQSRVYALAFDRNGAMLASGHGDSRVRLWDVRTAQAIGEPRVGHMMTVFALAFSPDGMWLVSGSRDGSIILWPMSPDVSEHLYLTGHTDWVSSINFYYDEGKQYMVTGAYDGLVNLWDMSLTRPNRFGSGFDMRDEVGAVVFSDDGSKLIVSAGVLADRETSVRPRVLIWDIDRDTWRAALQRIANREMSFEEVQYYLEQ